MSLSLFKTQFMPMYVYGIDGHWREGTQAVGELQFRSFFYATNVENCQKYISLKKKEVELRWSEEEEL